MKDKQEESRGVERFSHPVDGNNGGRFPDGRKGMQRRGYIEDKKIHATTKEALQYGVGDSVWADGSRREVGGSRKKFNGGESSAEGETRPLEQKDRRSSDKKPLALLYKAIG